jgi:hypothetical protein
LCACSASFFLSPCLSGSVGRNHFMIGLIKCAGFNRGPQLNKHRCARPQPRIQRRRRPRRGNRLSPVTCPRVLLRRPAAPGCGTRRIAVPSIVLLTRLGILRRNKQRNNPVKTTGLMAKASVTPSTLRRRRQQGRRSGTRGSPFGVMNGDRCTVWQVTLASVQHFDGLGTEVNRGQ